MLNRHVVRALEVLDSVFDVLKDRGLRPEHFFEWTSKALGGTTPRAYLAAKPLVDNESRLGIRVALNEFVTEQVTGSDSGPEAEDARTSEDTPTVTSEGSEAATLEADPRPMPFDAAMPRTSGCTYPGQYAYPCRRTSASTALSCLALAGVFGV